MFVLFFFLTLFVWFPCVFFPFLIVSLTTLWFFIILFVKATKSGSPDSCMSEECIHIERRRVTFNVDVQVHAVPSWRDYSLMERTAMWSSPKEVEEMGLSFCKTDTKYSQPIKVPEAPVKRRVESTFMDWEYEVRSNHYNLLELFDKVSDESSSLSSDVDMMDVESSSLSSDVDMMDVETKRSSRLRVSNFNVGPLRRSLRIKRLHPRRSPRLLSLRLNTLA